MEKSHHRDAAKSSANSEKRSRRTAVLFCGMLRNFEIGANSIKQHILYDKASDVFYFGPKDTDFPDINYTVGLMDQDGFFIKNPKEKFQETEKANTQKFLDTYKDNIVKYHFHDKSFSFFEKISSDLRPREDWLMGLNPARMISMFYNIGGVVDLFLEHVGSDISQYKKIVITRTDLVVYSKIRCKLAGGEIHIPFGEGFNANGIKNSGNAGVLYYKNMDTGDYASGGRINSFNDQIMVINEDDVFAFKDLFEDVQYLIKNKAPLSPETILYIICKRHGLKIIAHDDWDYEIYRDGKDVITSVLDTPDLKNIDRYHPRLNLQMDATPAENSSEILKQMLGDIQNIKRNLFTHSLLIGENVRDIPPEKFLSFFLRSQTRAAKAMWKEMSASFSRNGVQVYSTRDDEVRSPCAMRIGQKIILAAATDCFALYGPYISLEPGKYLAEFVFDEIDGDHVILDVISPRNTKIANKKIALHCGKILSIAWEIREPHSDLEIRLFAFPGFKAIFEYLLIRKL